MSATSLFRATLIKQPYNRSWTHKAARKVRALLVVLCTPPLAQPAAGITEIVKESARVADHDLAAGRSYDYSETDLESDGSKKTYAVRMLFGSPYRQLIEIDGKALPPSKQQTEAHKLEREIARRKRESPADRARRTGEFQKQQNRDERMMTQFVGAFDFTLVRQTQLDGRRVYEIQARPRAGYRPTDRESKVFTGMLGTLWIDEATYQWAKVQAVVIHPVSVAGFLATVEPGTRFDLEKRPVEPGTWLATHYSMTSTAKVFSIIPHGNREDQTYFNYHKSPAPPADVK
jgi:hypothetical protein